MRIIFSALIFMFLFTSQAFSQTDSKWKVPLLEVAYEGENEVKMKIDPGFRFAELENGDKTYRLFFHKNRPVLPFARIVDQETGKEIARGRGSYFFGNARFEFSDGREVKIKKIRNPNGYEIIGPYGPLFVVENHAVSQSMTYQESDFLTQAHFLFSRIKETQSPPAEIIINSTTTRVRMH